MFGEVIAKFHAVDQLSGTKSFTVDGTWEEFQRLWSQLWTTVEMWKMHLSDRDKPIEDAVERALTVLGPEYEIEMQYGHCAGSTALTVEMYRELQALIHSGRRWHRAVKPGPDELGPIDRVFRQKARDPLEAAAEDYVAELRTSPVEQEQGADDYSH
nr:hypothetical protein DA06_23035 [Georgenia sp. SUBG003]